MTKKFSKVLVGIVVLAAILFAAMYVALPKSAKASEAASNAIFRFTKVGNTHYSIGVIDDTITSAVIPEEYNGLPVAEIANNGFAYCDQLESVYIPNSIKKVR